jgi:hypothetical protein
VFGLFDLLIQSAKFLVQRIQIFFIRAQRNLILDSHPAQFQRLGWRSRIVMVCIHVFISLATSLGDQLDSPNKSRSGHLYGVKAVEALPGAIRAATLALLCPHA